MASGSLVVEVIEAIPPATSYATLDTRSGGSTPAESMTVWDFDASATEYMDFKCRLSEDYDGGGLTFQIVWMATSATSGEVVWEIAIRRMDAADWDTAHTYDFNTASDSTAPATNGTPVTLTLTFTDGADMDSWAAGEYAMIRIRRKHDAAGDDMAGDAELVGISGKET